MKLVLFHDAMGFDVQFQAFFLTHKNTPFWLYMYNLEKRVFQRIEYHKMMETLDDDLVLITLKDKGDFFGWNFNAFRDVPDAYFPENEELRYDKDFISFVEEYQEELMDILEVVTVPKGEKYRILKTDDMRGREILELEKEVVWSIAE